MLDYRTMETRVKLLWIFIVSSFISFCGQLDGNSDCPVSPDHFEEKKPPKAVTGGDVVLPCFPKFSINVNDDILEWGKGSKDIYAIQRTKIKHEDDDYKGRLRVSIEGWKKRDASLYLSGVKQSDEGRYCCCIRMNGKPTCTNVTLAVKEEDEETSTERPDNLQILPTETPTNSTGSNIRNWIIGGVSVFAGLICIVAAGLCCHCWKKSQSAGTDPRRGENQNAQEEDEGMELNPADDRQVYQRHVH